MKQEMTEEEMNTAIADGYYKWENIKRLQAIRSMFIKKCITSDFEFRYKWFYWLKALICLILKRTNGDYLHGTEICYFNVRDSGGEYSGSDWESCWVDEGIFKNWQVSVITDSSY